MNLHNKSVGMTPMGEAVHERWKTGEYSITAAAPCPPLLLLPLLVVRGSQRLMGYIRNRLLEDDKED